MLETDTAAVNIVAESSDANIKEETQATEIEEELQLLKGQMLVV